MFVLGQAKVKPMTIAIAAMCGNTHASQRGNIIVCTDTLISWGNHTSNTSGTKLYDLPHGFFATTASDVSRCRQFCGYLYAQLAKFEASDEAFVELVRLAIEDANQEFRASQLLTHLATFPVTKAEFLTDPDLVFRQQIIDEWRALSPEIDVIICGFSGGSPMIVRTDGRHIQECMVPGFACSGSGESAALDWLNFRKQHGAMSVQRTYYHVREAHDYASLSIGVGELCNMLLLRPNEPYVDIGACTPLRWSMDQNLLSSGYRLP